MPDDETLYVSGGTTTVISTDALLGDAQALVVVTDALAAMIGNLHIVSGLTLTTCQPLDVVERCIAAARDAHDEAQSLSTNLRTAMDQYTRGEQISNWLAEAGAAIGAFTVGSAVQRWFSQLPGPLQAAIALGLPWLARGLTSSESPTGPDEVEMPAEVTRVLSDPAIVELLRLAASSADEATMGFGGVPALSQAMLAGVGITGVASTAAMLAAYASLAGLLTETPVTVTETKASTGTVTSGFEARREKIPLPDTAPGGAQIRIDRIESAGAPPRFELFLGGTVDFNPLAGDDAFDMTSNVVASAGMQAGALRAVELAMSQAGISSASEVTFTGYSQGGLLASVLAASGDYNVKGLVTFGAPAGHVPLPTDIPVVIIEHFEDMVPAMGGVQGNTNAVLVQRYAFESAVDVPTHLAVPAHHMEYYEKTTKLMDEARSGQVTDASRRLDAFAAGADSVESTYYYASRTG